MHLTKKQVEEARNVYGLYWDSYQKGDVDTFASTLHDNYEMIGTSESEICHNKAEGIDFFKGQAEEVVGKAELRNRQINAIPVGDLVLINEMCDIFVLAGTGWAFYSKIRISTFLQETPSGWKVVQQHGSLPDMRVQEGETLAIDKISRENVELRDAVKRRTAELENKNRELEIEAALERVRARAMSMHKSDELNEVVSVLFEKLKDLQIPFTAVGIATGIEGSKDLNAFVCGQNEAGLVITNYRLPYFDNPIPKDLYSALEKQLDFFVGHYSKEEKDSFYEYVIEHTAEFRHLPEDIKRMIFESPTYTISMVAVKNAVFNINDFEGKILAENEVDIIKRFARVFDQAYTRFLDLQRAEAQAREAQIEAALERVRARTMAMHSSDELLETGTVLFKELSKLGVNIFNCGYVLMDDEAKRGWNYGVNPGDGSIRPLPTGIPQTGTKVLEAITESWKKQEPLLLIELGPQETIEHQTYIAENMLNFSLTKEQLLARSPERLVIHTFNFKHGYLLLVDGAKLTADQEEMVMRFAHVFEQTYIRFLDLQKAEAQAKEAKIEAALEKVRAQTMGMQASEDLSKVASVMFDQMKLLGGDLFAFGIVLCNKDKDTVEQWHSLGNEGMISPFSVPVDLDYIHRYRYDQWKSGEKTLFH
jgi:ketosteroid isomerase-like protein